MNEALRLFRETFAHTPTRAVQAPASCSLLGWAASLHQGLSLLAPLSAHVTAAGSPAQGGRMVCAHSRHPGRVEISTSLETPAAAPPWTRPLWDGFRLLRHHGVPLRPCRLTFHSSIPPGDWMGSRGAYQAALVTLYRELFPFTLTATGSTTPPERDSRGQLPFPQKAEKLALAAMSHPEAPDQILGCLFGREGNLLEWDGQSQAVEPVPAPMDHVFVLGVPHLAIDPAPSPDGERFQDCVRAAVRALGIQSLRSLEPKDLERRRKKLSLEEWALAAHIVRENRLVLHAAQALRTGDAGQFGHYLEQSHESCRDRLGWSRPELDRLVETARAHPACVGSRLLGHPAGAATVHVVQREKAEAFMRHLQDRYPRQPRDFVKPLAFTTAPGAGPLPNFK